MVMIWRSLRLRWKIALIALLMVFGLWIAGGYAAARYGTSPRHARVEPREELGGHRVHNVRIVTCDGLRLAAWYVPAGGDYAVIVVPGIRNSRRSAIANAEMYLSWGYTALLPDLRGTGESEGDRVSIGYHEREDLIACFKYLQGLGYGHIGAHGTSLGAAAICFAAEGMPGLSFAVLESSYDTIDNALANRMALYKAPYFLAWPVKLFAAFRLGVGAERIRPIDHVARFMAPTLILGGDSERVLQVSETRAMYERCSAPVKRIHLFKGGRHETFVRRFTEECKTAVRDFLEVAQAFPDGVAASSH